MVPACCASCSPFRSGSRNNVMLVGSSCPVVAVLMLALSFSVRVLFWDSADCFLYPGWPASRPTSGASVWGPAVVANCVADAGSPSTELLLDSERGSDNISLLASLCCAFSYEVFSIFERFSRVSEPFPESASQTSSQVCTLFLILYLSLVHSVILAHVIL